MYEEHRKRNDFSRLHPKHVEDVRYAKVSSALLSRHYLCAIRLILTSFWCRFAFLNAMAAHDYSHDWEQMTTMAERYDELLFHFLTGILSRQDADRTVIILRSDHGLQRGPMAMDYSLQTEHRRPWTEILVPEDLVASKEALFVNQHRMTTGFDLYNTMRSLLSRSKGQPDDEGIPHWSFDLLSDTIPVNRTCADAKVDVELCRGMPVSREYGVCNKLDKQQVGFCAAKGANDVKET